MRTRLLIILVMIIFPLVIQQGFAMCAVNEDWKDAPCFDMGAVSKMEFKKAWAPYYDYKGADWMESKKTEMFQASDDGIFDEWTGEMENFNVYMYYVSTDEIQRQFDYDPVFREETLAHYVEILILSSPIIAVGLIIIFVIRRKRNEI